MLTKTIKLLSILILICLSGQLALAQQQSNQQTANNTNPQPQPQYVDFTGFKGKVLEVKNRDPRSLASLLAPLGSGFKGAKLEPNSEFKTITVRDFPENIATIEDALKRLDVPMPAKAAEAPKPDVEIYGYVLIASQGDGATSDYPKAIDDVVKQLQSNLAFKNYRLLTSIVQRSRLGGNLNTSGTAVMPDKSIAANYEFVINRISPENESNDASPLLLSNMLFSFIGQNSEGQNPGSARLNTSVRLRDGEKVVVGTASLKDKALVLVLTTKILK
ncbi:MAG TPA: hypothetical protein PLK30_06785 [Blastocatellia bacterium]|nr:hypothetical protein [Blastocatellia bacterium]